MYGLSETNSWVWHKISLVSARYSRLYVEPPDFTIKHYWKRSLYSHTLPRICPYNTHTLIYYCLLAMWSLQSILLLCMQLCWYMCVNVVLLWRMQHTNVNGTCVFLHNRFRIIIFFFFYLKRKQKFYLI